VRGDGDGWVETPIGPRWGRYGAAGLLLYSVNNVGETVILLQHRATWVAQGDTWALPGGARDSHETPTQAALREAWEEAGIPPAGVRVDKQKTTAVAGPWHYTTVIGFIKNPLIGEGNAEAHEHRWVPINEVDTYDLLPGFAAAWPELHKCVQELLI
jgi:hypothetical protein